VKARVGLPPLPETTILLVEVGSTAHGTGIPGGEDHDEIGVVVETPEHLVRLDADGFRTVMQRTQPEGAPSGPGDVDRTLHSLRQFLRLSAVGNPSILMTFWSPVEFVTPEGEELRALGDAFVGRHVIPRYRGYMQDQGRRALGLLGTEYEGRDDGDETAHGYATKCAMHAARLAFQGIELVTTGRLQLPIQGEPADWLRSVRRGDVSLDDWWGRCLELDAQLARLAETASIPSGPDRARIDAWSIDVHRRFWR
jgi:uncharacterized protein